MCGQGKDFRLLSQPAAIVDTYRTVWSQGDLTNVILSGNNTLKYTNMNFVGMETIANPVNASSMTLFHIDIWTPNMTTFRVKLVDLGANGVYGGGDDVEHEVSITPILSGWNSLNMLLSNFTNLTTKAHIGQIIISGNPPGAGVVYVDNMYFSNEVILSAPILSNFNIPAKQVGDAPFIITPPSSASAGSFSYMSSNPSVAQVSGNTITVMGQGTAIITATQAASGSYLSASINANLVVTVPPATAAPTPTKNPADVLSLFSNAYTNLPGIDWFPFWNQSTQYQQVQIQGDDVKRYYNLNYEGVQFASNLNVQSMTHLHIDVWTTNCTTLRIYPIPGGAASFVDLNPTLLGWNSYDIPLSSFNLTANELNGINGINQFKFEATPFGASNVYIDNVYFWKPPTTVNLKLFIEGYYDVVNHQMVSAKANQSVPSATNEVTTLTVQLLNQNTLAIEHTATTELRQDGTAICKFTTAPSGSFFLKITTWNTVQTYSKLPVVVGSTPLTYNFSNAASKAAGDNQKLLEPGVYGIYSGNFTIGGIQDPNIDNSDYSIWEADYNDGNFNYIPTDLNGDANPDNADYSIWEGNYNDGIYEILPDPIP